MAAAYSFKIKYVFLFYFKPMTKVLNITDLVPQYTVYFHSDPEKKKVVDFFFKLEQKLSLKINSHQCNLH